MPIVEDPDQETPIAVDEQPKQPEQPENRQNIIDIWNALDPDEDSSSELLEYSANLKINEPSETIKINEPHEAPPAETPARREFSALEKLVVGQKQGATDLEIKNRIVDTFGSTELAALALGAVEAVDPIGLFDITAAVQDGEMKENIRFLKEMHPGVVYGTEALGMLSGGLAAKLVGKGVIKLLGKETFEKLMRGWIGKGVAGAGKAATAQQEAISKLVRSVAKKQPLRAKTKFAKLAETEKLMTLGPAMKALTKAGISARNAAPGVINATLLAASHSTLATIKDAAIFDNMPQTSEMWASSLKRIALGTAVGSLIPLVPAGYRVSKNVAGGLNEARKKLLGSDKMQSFMPVTTVKAMYRLFGDSTADANKFLKKHFKNIKGGKAALAIMRDPNLLREAREWAGRKGGSGGILRAGTKTKEGMFQDLNDIHNYQMHKRGRVLDEADNSPVVAKFREKAGADAKVQARAQERTAGEAKEIADEVTANTSRIQDIDEFAKLDKAGKKLQFDDDMAKYNADKDALVEMGELLKDQNLLDSVKAGEIGEEILKVRRAILGVREILETGNYGPQDRLALSKILEGYNINADVLRKLGAEFVEEGGEMLLSVTNDAAAKRLLHFIARQLSITKGKLSVAARGEALKSGITNKAAKVRLGKMEKGLQKPTRSGADEEAAMERLYLTKRNKDLKHVKDVEPKKTSGKPAKQPESLLPQMNEVADQLNEVKIQTMHEAARKQFVEPLLEIINNKGKSWAARVGARNKLNAILDDVTNPNLFDQESADILKELSTLVKNTRAHGDAPTLQKVQELITSDYGMYYGGSKTRDIPSGKQMYIDRARLMQNALRGAIKETVGEEGVKVYDEANHVLHNTIALQESMMKKIAKDFHGSESPSVSPFDWLFMMLKPGYAKTRLQVAAATAATKQYGASNMGSRAVLGLDAASDYGKKVIKVAIDMAEAPFAYADNVVTKLGMQTQATTAAHRIGATLPPAADRKKSERSMGDSARVKTKAYNEEYDKVRWSTEAPLDAQEKYLEMLLPAADFDEATAQSAALDAQLDDEYLYKNIMTKTVDFMGRPQFNNEELDRLMTAMRVLDKETVKSAVYDKVIDGTLDELSAKVFRDRRPQMYIQLVEKIMGKLPEMDKDGKTLGDKLSFAQRSAIETLIPGVSLGYISSGELIGGIQKNAYAPNEEQGGDIQTKMHQGERAESGTQAVEARKGPL